MPYPIQPQNQIDNFTVWVEISGAVYDWTQYVNEFSYTTGDLNPDLQRVMLSPGIATISFVNPPSNGTTLVPGTGIDIRSKVSASAYPLYMGKILDIDTRRELSDKTGTHDYIVTVTAGDFANEIINFGTVDAAKQFSLSSGEFGYSWDLQTTWDNYIDAIWSPYSSGVYAGEYALSDIYQMNAETVYAFPWPYYMPSSSNWDLPYPVSSWIKYGQLASYTIGLNTVQHTFTDGTHTSTTANLFNYVDIDWSRSTKSLAKKVTLRAQTVNRGIDPTGNIGALQPSEIVYSKETSSVGSRSMEFMTATVMDNTGWNYVLDTCTGRNEVADYNDTYKWGPSNTVTYNGHGVLRLRQVWTSAPLYTFSFVFADAMPNIISSPAGGTTGNWYFNFAIRGESSTNSMIQPIIDWVNASGAIISTIAGVQTAVNNTTWKNIQVSAAAPSGAVSANVYFQDTYGGANNILYVSEAYFGQQGGHLFFDGDTAEDTDYVYTWTGTRWMSPSQRTSKINVTPGPGLNAISTFWLNRNQSPATSNAVTVNLDIDNAKTHLFLQACHQAPKYVYTWFDGVKSTQVVSGFEVTVTPQNAMAKIALVNTSTT